MVRIPSGALGTDVDNRQPHVSRLNAARRRLLREDFMIGVELVRLGEIHEASNPGVQQSAELRAGSGVISVAGVFAGHETPIE
jgi:hypothetical protein